MAVRFLPEAQDEFQIIHPLFDTPEPKVDLDQLGPMPMTRNVRWALVALRVYLIAILALILFRVASLVLF